MHGGSTIQKMSLEIDWPHKSGCLWSSVSVLAGTERQAAAPLVDVAASLAEICCCWFLA
jgi:hypothetical protein